MIIAYIAVGSNLGERLEYLNQAQERLSKLKGIRFLKSSAVYETEPVGGAEQGKYLNAVWEIETSLAPQELMKQLLAIEKKLGRVRTELHAPRTIDLDILFYQDRMIEEPGLSIPHPRLQEREFVLKPLMDLCPDFTHPRLKKTVRELSQNLNPKA